MELKSEVSNYVKSFKYTSYTSSLQNILHDFSVQAVNGLESAFIADNQKQIKFCKTKLGELLRIQDSSNERAKEELVRQIEKLKAAEGINTPSEGFVFTWNGTTYKLTGNFASAIKFLVWSAFKRFGPIEPKEDDSSTSQGNSEPLTIGVVPGAFKPPHKGHLSMVEALAENADKVIVIVSTPTGSGALYLLVK